MWKKNERPLPRKVLTPELNVLIREEKFGNKLATIKLIGASITFTKPLIILKNTVNIALAIN